MKLAPLVDGILLYIKISGLTLIFGKTLLLPILAYKIGKSSGLND